MAHIFEDNTRTIGKTPLVNLNRIAGSKATVLAKIEGRNPSFSVKCRLGAAMVWDAEDRKLLWPGREIVEATSGNTGIALAFVAAARGYSVTLVMPETMSLERRSVMAMLGAKLVLTPGAEGMAGAVRQATEIQLADPERFFQPEQFKNPANPRIHELTTGPEIWEDTSGQLDVLVAGVGTGGTITGASRFLKKVCRKGLLAVAVEPKASPVISQKLAGEPLKPGAHKIQGIGAGFIPDVLDLSLLDRVEQADNDEAVEFSRRLAREEGILCGISSGAAAAVAARLASQDEFEGKTIVTVLPDAGERYLSTILYEGVAG